MTDYDGSKPGEGFQALYKLRMLEIFKLRKAIETLTAEAMECSEDHMQYLEARGLVDDYRDWLNARRAAAATKGA